MKFSFLLSAMLLWAGISAQAQQIVYEGSQAERFVKGAETVRWDPKTKNATYIRFAEEARPSVGGEGFADIFRQAFRLPEGYNLSLSDSFTDELDIQHLRYAQYQNSIPVEGGGIIYHQKDGKLLSINGALYPDIKATDNAALSLDAARAAALRALPATKYMWEIQAEEALLKEIKADPRATYFPEGQLVYVAEGGKVKEGSWRLAYKFDVYAAEPMMAYENIYVDAITGQIIHRENLIHEANGNGTAVTKYSGTQKIKTDSLSASSFRLRETTRGKGVETYNMKKGTSYAASVDFADGDNYWNNANSNYDEAATDAHFGAQKTYDYYWNTFSRNSYDKMAGKLISYVHYSTSYTNAFWNGVYMTYGDGSGKPLTTLDICGHELTHGVTGNSAKLVYSYESGALNESFSDIFGTAIEHYAYPTAADYLIGEDCISGGIRDMSNPNRFSDPDTYGGTYWYTGSSDNGGVHTNSGVQNFWFYLLAKGGKGTNDKGWKYDVKAIGLTDAAKIAYRNLTVYLSSNSDYDDARFYAVQAAKDLFGGCSQQLKSTGNAWYAVGLGTAYDSVLKASFVAPKTTLCKAPYTATFYNTSTGATSYKWEFGDGGTSTSANPAYTYAKSGTYTVKLTAYACNGVQKDSVIKKDYIVADGKAPLCNAVFMPGSGTATTQTACIGYLFDSGADTMYANNTNSTLTISSTGGMGLKLHFKSFNFEDGYDYLAMYDGTSASAPLIGIFTGDKLPMGGYIYCRSGAVTIQQYTDGGEVRSGFELFWQCVPKKLDNPGIALVKSPLTGRQYTASALDSQAKVSLLIKNYGSNTLYQIPVAYRINGGAPVRDTLKRTMYSGDTFTFTFAKRADLRNPGKYAFDFWTAMPADSTWAMDTIRGHVVKNLANGPVILPYFEDFEKAAPLIYQHNTMGLEGLVRYDFNRTGNGRLTLRPGGALPAAGRQSLGMDATFYAATNLTQNFVLTLNLESYKGRKNVLCSFLAKNNGQEAVSDKIYVRGSEKDAWALAYTFSTYPAVGSSSSYSFNISSLLASKGQSFSKTTQIKFEQTGNEATDPFNPSYSDGLEFDNVKVYANFGTDMAVSELLLPTTGREFTSKALKTSETVKVRVWNLGTISKTNIPVNYKVDGGSVHSETIKSTVSAGNYVDYTFSAKDNFADSGNHLVKVWTSFATDSARGNDTMVFTVRQIPNRTLQLPFAEGFEGMGPDVVQGKNQFGLMGAERCDYWTTGSYGRIRTFAGPSFARTGKKAVTLDANSSGYYGWNSLYLTLNLAKYAKSDVFLDFSYMAHGDEKDTADKVWVRGSDKGLWVEVYDLYTNKASDGTYSDVTDINITQALAAKSQILTSSAQIRFGQYDNFTAATITGTDGYTFDDIKIWGIVNDVALTLLDSPQTGCGLRYNEPVKVRVKNTGTVIQYKIPLTLDLGNGSPLIDTMSKSLQPGDSLDHIFLNGADLSVAGTYNVKAYASLPGDIDGDNDTMRRVVVSKLTPRPFIVPSGATSFCPGGNVVLDAGKSYQSYKWSNGDTTASITVDTPGTYVLEVTAVSGCRSISPPLTVNVFQPIKPVISQTKDSLWSTPAAQYQWYKGGSPIAGTARFWKTKTPGAYQVETVDSNGCKAMSDTFRYILTSLGSDPVGWNARLFPNPARRIIYLQGDFSGKAPVVVTLWNALGQRVGEQRLAPASAVQEISLEGISEGIYTLRIQQGEEMAQWQIVKVRE